jgi:hypothetical protein
MPLSHTIAARTCRHWLGCMFYKCKADLVPRNLAAGPALGWVLRVPCAGRHGRGGMAWTPCDKYHPKGSAECGVPALKPGG